MKFLVYLGLPSFLKGLTKGCTVYTASYALVKEEKNGFVLLTSDLGAPNGVIHAIRITVTEHAGPGGQWDVPPDYVARPDLSPEEVKPITLAAKARKQIEEFLASKGIEVRPGAVLLTEGMEEALEFWNTLGYSLKELAELLEAGKEVALQ